MIFVSSYDIINTQSMSAEQSTTAERTKGFEVALIWEYTYDKMNTKYKLYHCT